jgi:hypothetical protein
MLRPMAFAIALAVCSLSGSSSAYAQYRLYGTIATKFYRPAFSAMQSTFPGVVKEIPMRLRPELGGRQFGLGREPWAWEHGPTISEKVTPW